jgi:hypothetical protein
MTSALLVLLLLSQTQRPDSPPAGALPPPLPASVAGGMHYLARLDAAGLALLPGGAGGSVESYAQLTPMLVLDGGENLGVNLGAPVRLRVGGGAPGAGLVRREDWDSLSDWGQLVRALKLGSDTSPVGLWVGALDSYSLLSGHLVRRYSNRANPDYHPAGAFLTGTVGPLYAEAFSSDVLGARLMGAEVALDLAHLFTGPQEQAGRYTLALSAVHDWGRAGGHSPQVTLAHLDGTAVLVVRPGYELHVLAGWGGRPGVGGAWGAVAGVGADAVTPTLDARLRLEVRGQRGGFRQGLFGPDYELARLRAAGPSGLPVVEAPFPEGFSVYGEAVVGWDAVRLGGLRQRHLHLSLGAEAFNWGRVDVDARLAAQLAERRVEVAASALAVGVGKPEARYLYSGEVRWHFAGWLYAVGQGGTLLFPTPEGTLRLGAFASLGLGVDHAR